MPEASFDELMTSLHKDEWGRLLAALISELRDIELAEDALAEAWARAMETWPQKGIPDSPASWLFRTAKNKSIDLLRRAATFERNKNELEQKARELEQSDRSDKDIDDHRLLLMFLCCHPALHERAQVALTLQTLGGLSTREIARAFLTSEATMAQRLVRAKRKIKKAEIPFVMPAPEQLPERLSALLSTIYLIFNEGYAQRSGTSPYRVALVQEAILLGKTMATFLPRDPEVAGLLSLMLLHDSRRHARFVDGKLIPLVEQDRNLWDRDRINEATAVLESALRLGRPGPYQIQAAISAVHAEAPSGASCDWKQITLLYRRLFEMTGSTTVKLNGAVALSFAASPESGLEVLDQISAEGQLTDYQPFWAARADMLRRQGAHAEARQAYLRALELTENQIERLFLNDRLVALDPDASEKD